jgi:signal transduction histidine kinase
MLRPWLSAKGVTGLAGVFGLIFALGSVAIGGALYLFAGSAMTHAEDMRIDRERARLLALANGRAPSTDEIARRIRERGAKREISSIGHRLTDARGTVIAGAVDVRMARPDQRDITFRQPGGPWEVARASRVALPGGAELTIVAESESAEDMGKILWPLFGIALALATSAGVVTSILLGRLIAARLRAIGTTATAITAGDYSRRVPIDSLGGTFAEQAHAFNRMLDRIEDLMNNYRQVSSDLAHDLRTPLTRLQGTLRDAVADDIDPARCRALILAAGRECDGVLSLFAALLRIGEVEAGRRRSHARPLRLDALTEDVVESYEPAFADAGRELRLGYSNEAWIFGDADLFNQLLVNLIENALLHTPVGSLTTVSVEPGPKAVTLSVRDNGLGIAEPQRREVLGRFVRLESSRSTPGHGLGLALVVAVARFHDAQIDLDDAAPGLVVRVHFPIVDPPLDLPASQ